MWTTLTVAKGNATILKFYVSKSPLLKESSFLGRLCNFISLTALFRGCDTHLYACLPLQTASAHQASWGPNCRFPLLSPLSSSCIPWSIQFTQVHRGRQDDHCFPKASLHILFLSSNNPSRKLPHSIL
jgi:hypothetical protein